MISNVFLDKTDSNIISKNYIQYLLKLESINYLRNNNLINDDIYLESKVQIKKSHIGK